jgi:3'-5' exoribonuclease
MKQLYVNGLTPGLNVDEVFAIGEKTQGKKKNGDGYLSFVFSDKTGEIKAVAWDNVPQIASVAGVGDVVRVLGTVSEYRGSLQLTVKDLKPCDKNTADPADFLPVTQRNTDKMFERLQKTVDEQMKDAHIRALFAAFWEDPDFVSSFKNAPGAKKMHHAYLGGLLEHTLSMTVLAGEIAKHYSGVNLDILLAGVILHDIGKTKEFEYDFAIDYSTEGKLLTHIVIGCGMVDEKLRLLPDFPKDKAALIKHMIVSHHGTREFGSPEPPRTIEAVLLNYIDEIDAKMNGIREFIAKEDPQSPWTSYNFMLGRHIYKGIAKETEPVPDPEEGQV